MEKNEKYNSVLVPQDALESPLIDPRGKIWRITEKAQKSFLGLWTSRHQELELKAGLAEALEELLKAPFRSAIQAWKEETLQSIGTVSKQADPILNDCLAVGERDFRKSFVKKLGKRGEEVWGRILDDQFQELARVLNQRPTEQNQLSVSPVLPAGTRLYWNWPVNNRVYRMFLVEAPPQRRTINIFGHTKHLAFPYMYFLVCFTDNNLRSYYCFYGKKSLTSKEDPLYFPNLPNIMEDWPHPICLGNNKPDIDFAKPDWFTTFINYFWDSGFVEHGDSTTTFWEWAINNIPEVSSLNLWEQLSKTKPEKILSLPWQPFRENIQEFATKVLENLVRSDNGPKNDAGAEDYQKIVSGLKRRFQEKLEEELHFLGAHFAIPVDFKKRAEQSLLQTLENLSSRLEEGMRNRCSGIAAKVSADYLENAVQALGAKETK